MQDSAYPYHDWNERITGECYAPNSASRILDAEGRIVQIVNNYAKISFNFGPTLLAWLEANAPDVYREVLTADRVSRQRFSGHGSALAQAYNHMILPLANRRDKVTQVRWALRDFEHRFGRRAEGMWLPETAADLETLDVLAENGIRFTILAPHQAARVRRAGSRAWREVGGSIDPSMGYRLRLRPSGRTIQLLFYDGPISRAVAFEGLLTNGEQFARRLLDGFDGTRTWPQLVHIATDGETYGHHHRHGDMALAYALHYIESGEAARLTNYGEFLERHPPTHEVEIVERTSWSCAHGVERWQSDCGCNSGLHPGWGQFWRAPLRQALDWLRDALAPRFEERAGRLFRDPWAARDAYIDVVLDRSGESVDRFLGEQAGRQLEGAERVEALKLMELQRHAMLMYTSCGWFFDELSGIETVQVLQYAGRVVQLAQELFGGAYEERFRERIAAARSNLPELQDGARIYDRSVAPAAIDLVKVGAHYAVTSLFEPYGERSRIYCYDVEREAGKILTAGQAKLAVGQANISSQVTLEWARVTYAVLHFGDHNLNAAVRRYRGEDDYRMMEREVGLAFERADLAEVIRLLDRYFEGELYTPKLLFRDQQRNILDQILAATLAEVEAAYRAIYERHATLMRFLHGLGVPQPKALQTAAEFVLNTDLRRALADGAADRERIAALLDEAARLPIQLDGPGLGFAIQQAAERLAERLWAGAEDLDRLRQLEAAVELAQSPPFEADLWKVQNVYYRLLEAYLPRRRAEAERGDPRAQEWAAHFAALGDRLLVRGGA